MTRLSDEQYQNVIKTMAALGGKKSAPDAPQSIGRLAILPLEPISSLPMIVSVRDVSQSTIGLEMRKSMSVGSKFLVCLTGTRRGRGVACTVARWFPISTSACYVTATYGSEMALPIAADEIDQTIAAEELRACADAAAA